MTNSIILITLILTWVLGTAAEAQIHIRKVVNPYEKFGYIDTKGNWVIKPRFESAGPFVDGYATVEVVDPKTNKIVYRTIDRTGKFIKDRYPRTSEYYGWRQPYSKYWQGYGPYFTIGSPDFSSEHFLNKDGTPAFDRSFITASGFSHKGIAFAKKEYWMPYEIINRSGKTIGIVLDPRIDWFGHWSEGMCNFQINVPHKNQLMCGFVNSDGWITIPGQFDFTSDFHEGLAAVLQGKNWYYIDSSGRKIISLPSSVSAAGDFCDGIAPVAIGGESYENQYFNANRGALWGFIDKRGKLVVEPTFLECAWNNLREIPVQPRFEKVLCRTSNGYAYGYIDKTGKLVIPPKYVHAGSFSEGVAAASDGDTTFIPEQWKSGIGERAEMVKKLFAEYKVIGMSKETVLSVLGYPWKYLGTTQPYKQEFMAANSIQYGVYSSSCTGSGYSLQLEFENGKVSRYRYYSTHEKLGNWKNDNTPPQLP